MDLKQALRAGQNEQIAIVGAGGKTTALFLLARQLEPPVLVTASTHLALEQLSLADQHFVLTGQNDDHQFLKDLPLNGVTLLTGPVSSDARSTGLAPDTLNEIHNIALERGLPLLLEADGSRRLPLKAPAAHEPAVPQWIEMVIVTAGMQGIDKPLSPEHVHRPEIFAQLGGLNQNDPVTMDHLVKVLSNPDGGLKNIPQNARRVALLNQADTPELRRAAAGAAPDLLKSFDAVLIAALQDQDRQVWETHETTAGIILAAGGSTRFGQPKVLLNWHGQPFIRQIAHTALQAGLWPVIVVLGAVAEPVQAALEGLPVEFVHNADWQAGQGRSVQLGVSALPAQTGAAVFLLGDQPQVPAELIQSLITSHHTTLSPVTAPQVNGRRANPVLFDRSTFPELRELTGDTGGRALFESYPITWVPWHDERLLWDVDTPEDYRRLLED